MPRTKRGPYTTACAILSCDHETDVMGIYNDQGEELEAYSAPCPAIDALTEFLYNTKAWSPSAPWLATAADEDTAMLEGVPVLVLTFEDNR